MLLEHKRGEALQQFLGRSNQERRVSGGPPEPIELLLQRLSTTGVDIHPANARS
jgi:hypothetical protein